MTYLGAAVGFPWLVTDLGAAVGPPWLGTELGAAVGPAWLWRDQGDAVGTRGLLSDLRAAVGPPWLVTEAPDHQQKESSRVRPGAADCSSARANSLIYMLKRVGLKLHPCFTPWPCRKKSVCFLPFLTRHLLFVCSRPSCKI